MGHEVFGCDICQDVCPWNRKAPATTAAEFQPREGLVNPALEWLAGITSEEFREKFRGSAVRRAKRSGLRRNAVIAMGNSGDRRFEPLLENLKSDEDDVVAESAGWAAKRLSRGRTHVGADALIRPVERSSKGSCLHENSGASLRWADEGIRPYVARAVCGG